MRSYPVPYLSLLAICFVYFVAGLLVTGSTTLFSGKDPAFFLYALPICCGVMSIASFVFWIVGLIHALTNKALEGTEKIVWILVLIFLNALGAVIYFFVAPNPAVRTDRATEA